MKSLVTLIVGIGLGILGTVGYQSQFSEKAVTPSADSTKVDSVKVDTAKVVATAKADTVKK